MDGHAESVGEKKNKCVLLKWKLETNIIWRHGYRYKDNINMDPVNGIGKVVEASLNVTAPAPKPDFVFRRNGRVHLNRRGASVKSTTGNRGVRINGSNTGYTIFRGSVKSTGYLLHSPVSPSLPLPCVTVCHHISIGIYCIYQNWNRKLIVKREKNQQVATIRCLLLTSVSTCFGHHFARLQENRNLHSARILQRSAPQPLPTTSSRTRTVHQIQ